MDAVERCVLKGLSWDALPDDAKQTLGQSKSEYEDYVRSYSIEHCLSWSDGAVRHIMKESEFYTLVIENHQETLRVYPYHVADKILRWTKVTSFQFYIDMLENMLKQERAYDTMPNFTACDCLRLVGIGRNEYMDILNKCRGKGWLWNKMSIYIREELPKAPLPITPQPWWQVRCNFSSTENSKMKSDLTSAQQAMLQKIATETTVSSLDLPTVQSLYSQSLVHYMVPIRDTDRVFIPLLRDFVMNRSVDDVLEKSLYRILMFVDEKTTIAEIAQLIGEDLGVVKNAISLFCRLGFAERIAPQSQPPNPEKHIALLVDRSIAALLMMGNLSPALKPHAVTLYEAGKLGARDMEAFLHELQQGTDLNSKTVEASDLGAQEFFQQATSLHRTLTVLSRAYKVDMLRVESLRALDQAASRRLIESKYCFVVSMLNAKEVFALDGPSPIPFYSPPSALFESPWLSLFLYVTAGRGVPTLLLPQGFRLDTLPETIIGHPHYMITTHQRDELSLPLSKLLLVINDTAIGSTLTIQPATDPNAVIRVALPSLIADSPLSPSETELVERLVSELGLGACPGILKLLRNPDDVTVPLSLQLGVPLSDSKLNEIVIASFASSNLLAPAVGASHAQAMASLQARLIAFAQHYAIWRGDTVEAHPTKSPRGTLFGDQEPETDVTAKMRQEEEEVLATRSDATTQHIILPSTPLFFNGNNLCPVVDPFDL
eukprot:c17062_g1_i2.p1 GENE.c17062_g1_i2~~c17062_g1_i2.p1  ORF type:complete len:725 (+),score=150.44 c17062_g1_i2:26-2176(+)